MPKAYSRDLVERRYCSRGDPVRRDARQQERLRPACVGGKSAAAALVSADGSFALKLRGGAFLAVGRVRGRDFDLIAQRPDLTLVETVAELRKRRIKIQPQLRSGVF